MAKDTRDRKGYHQERAKLPHVQALTAKNRATAKTKRRAIIDVAKEVPCHRCGGEFPPCAMDFHHRDSFTKIKRNTREHGMNVVPLRDLLAEIEKCDVYCANCHRIIEFGEDRW